MKIPLSFVTISIISMLSVSSMAQDKLDTLLASNSYKKGDSLMKEGKYDSSAYYMLIAVDIFEKSVQWQRLADALNTLSEDNWRLGRLNEGEEYARKAQVICQTYLGEDHLIEADALNNLGNIKIMRGMLNESLVDHEAGLDIKKLRLDEDDPILAGSYSNIGVIYDYLGDYDRALDYYKKALVIDEKVSGGKHADIAMSYNNIGSIYQFKRDNSTALKYYEKALQIDIEVLGDEHPDLADIYNNIGTIHYYNGSFDLAGDYYEKALRIRTNSFEDSHPKLAESYNNVGTILYEKEDFDRAFEYYLKALKIREEVFGKEHSSVVSVYHNLADLSDKRGDADATLKYYTKALEISKKSLAKDHPDIAKSHAHIGRLYRSRDQYDLALFHLNKALFIYKKNFGERHPDIGRTYNSIGTVYNIRKQYDIAIDYIDKGLIANSESEGLMSQGYSQYYYLNSLRTKAETLYLRYVEDRDIDDLENSLNNFLKCDTLIANMRRSNLRHSDRISLGLTSSKVYQIAIIVSQLFYEKTADTKYQELSFFFSERNKGAILFQTLVDQYAKGVTGIPENLLDLERSLLVDESFYRSEILNMKLKKKGYDTSRMSQFEDRLFVIKGKVDSLKRSFEKNFPNYYELKYTRTTIKLEEIQERLKPSQALVEYVESEDNLFAFLIQKRKFDVITIPITEKYDSIVDMYLNSLDFRLIKDAPEKAFEQYSKSANRIYNKILNPVIRDINPEITQLIIVPDGELAYAPWDILLTAPATDNDYKSLKYLLHDYSISYSNSASLLFNQFHEVPSSSRSTLAFAPAYEEQTDDKTLRNLGSTFRDELSPLKWNEDEIKTIEEYFVGEYFVGDQATEDQFKKSAPNYQVLHLAMHAFVDDKTPMLSKLVFTQNQNSLEDGMLHTYELLNMNLNAELAVLSACKTGLGKIQRGEGVMSLGRAFSYAGCQSVVISHWSIDDRSTSFLMNEFYKYLADGFSKDEAMRKAKLNFVKETHGIETHPYYWAGFVVLGNSDPLSGQKTNWLVIILSIAGFAVIIIFYFRYK